MYVLWFVAFVHVNRIVNEHQPERGMFDDEGMFILFIHLLMTVFCLHIFFSRVVFILSPCMMLMFS